MRTMYEITCVVCSTLFLSRHRKTRYCSKRCIWVDTKGPEFNARIARDTVVERAKAQRRTGTAGYVKWFGRHEHRVVAERMLGRPLRKREIVHHIDEDKHNNDPSNLVIITQGAHMREHGLGMPGVTPAHTPWKHRRHSEDDPNSMFCNEDIRRMREMSLCGGRQNDIAQVFGIKQPYVSQIVLRKRWAHV